MQPCSARLIPTMETRLADPHNHVPEVSPDDVWGDAETMSPHFPAAATILPPKRTTVENPPKSGQNRLEEGLRIESKSRPAAAEETATRLEVTEIDGSVLRLEPDESAAPKVPRQVTFHERKPTHRKGDRGEGKDWGIASKTSLRWLVGIGFGISGLVVAAMLALPKVNVSTAARKELTKTAPVVETVTALDILLPLQPDAEQVFRIYARSAVVDDFLPHLRNRAAVEPLVRAAGCTPLVSKDWIPNEATTWRVVDGKDVAFGVLEGKLPSFNSFRAYLAKDGEQMLLDWKATTAYSTATFPDLEKRQGDPSEIRGFILPSRFFTSVFPEQEYLSYQFLSPDRHTTLWAYARRDSSAGAAIAKLFRSGEIIDSTPEETPVTLRLAPAPAGSQPNQWLVDEFLHDDWLLP